MRGTGFKWEGTDCYLISVSSRLELATAPCSSESSAHRIKTDDSAQASHHLSLMYTTFSKEDYYQIVSAVYYLVGYGKEV